ncbi:MAG: FAD-binding protein [Chitinophagales bacterium]|nr:FAD-binding protein [Chitinophagales bacterium]
MNVQQLSFGNWGENIKSSSTNYFQPKTEEEIITIIKTNSKIRVVGSGHSWSPLCITKGILLNLDFYNKILEINKETKQVRAQAGIKLWQLIKALKQHQLSLENLGSIDQQSIAGAISTGTHGTGLNFQILGSQIVELTLLKANGEKITINKQSTPDLYAASIVNLGCLGVVSEVVIQAVSAFNIADETQTIPFETVIENLNTYLTQNDYFKFWWLPPTEKTIIYQFQQTNKKTNDSRLRRLFQDRILSVLVYRFVVLLCKFFPNLTHAANRFLTSQIHYLNRIAESENVFIVPEPPKHLETEWAFDLKDAKAILKDYKTFVETEKLNLSFIQEIRFTKADNFWLSSCYGRDTIWIGFYAYKHENWETNLKKFETFATKHNGRPHWGKLSNVNSSYLKQQYSNFEKFLALRAEFDPENKFLNEYLRKCFGLEKQI